MPAGHMPNVSKPNAVQNATAAGANAANNGGAGNGLFQFVLGHGGLIRHDEF